jgi:hypothetical protein
VTAIPSENPFRGPARQSDWAQTTRLAGDRAAILLADLRRRVAGIDGLAEELQSCGGKPGWELRYRLSETTLFDVLVLPGRLEATIGLEPASVERLLGSLRVSQEIKQAIASAEQAGEHHVRFPLASATAVRFFSRLVLAKARSLTRAAARPRLR